MSSGQFPENLTALLQEFERSSLREVHIRRGEIEIYLSRSAGGRPSRAGRNAQARAAVPAALSVSPPLAAEATRPAVPATAAGTADIPPGAAVITAPNIGTFYRSPKPGAAPYVEVGDTIAAGDELCLIEVMKLFTSLKSDRGGRIHAILVEDGVMVTAGQPLFIVVEV